MNGAHRSTTQSPVVSARKSATWLLSGAALITMVLGLLGLVIYLPIAHPASVWPLAIGVQGASWAVVLAHLAWVLARRRPRAPAQVARVGSEACLLLCITIGLLYEGGDRGGRAHGPFGYAIAGVGLVLLLAIAAYWVAGERRLRAVLERRRR